MIEINRTFSLSGGLLNVETLSGYTFTRESEAHTFLIDRTDGYGYEGEITARFVRADGVTVFIDGEVAMEGASVTLPPECYAVPGSFLLVIFHVVGQEAGVIYAARGTVLASESGTVVAASGAAANIEAQIQEILSGLSSTINTANLVALFARNIGEVEGEIDTFQDSVDTLQDEFDNVMNALAAQDFRTLNGPNLLPYQPEGVSVNVPSGDVITETITIPIEDATAAAQALTYTVTNANITAGMVLHGIKSSNTSVVFWGMVTGTAAAGSMSVQVAARPDAHNNTVTVTLYICACTTAVLPYGEEARHYYSNHPYINSSTNPNYTGDPGEEISERVVTLTGNDIVTDDDGVSYNTAVQFTVQNAPSNGQNNYDILVFNHGTDGGTGTREVNGQTETFTYGPSGIINELTDGEKYTLSCWARITSGNAARLFMAYGQSSSGYTPYPPDRPNAVYKDISGSGWQRVWWTFVYHASISSTTLRKRVGVGVCRYADGVVQLCGFRLVHGGLMGDNTVDTLAIDVAEAQETVAALETDVSSALASIAPVETGNTASANFAAGALVVWKNRLYKTSAAVASGATWAVGTNLTATTLAAELAALVT